MSRWRSYYIGLATISLWLLVGGGVLGAKADRAEEGLLALYNFCEPSGPIIQDISGIPPSLPLRIELMQRVQREGSQLKVTGDTRIKSLALSEELVQVIKQANAFSIEAWITPGLKQQKGPARIVTLSRNGSERCFTLGQDGDAFDVRCRSTQTNANGIPSLGSKDFSIRPELTHVIYTRSPEGQLKLYLNGALNHQGHDEGTLQAWKTNVQLGLANESDGNRAWKGTYHLVALFGRALNEQEVAAHYQAGSQALDTSVAPLLVRSPEARFFDQEVAPILANHCLECHDSFHTKGGLDLSKQASAMKGSKHEAVILPGDPEGSVLWESVWHDDMPEDRPALSLEQKQVLKRWIEQGATWGLDPIDPVLFVHGHQNQENWVRRLTREEYVQTIGTTFQIDIRRQAMDILPTDARADGFSNTAYNLTVDLQHVDAYAELASIIVQKLDIKAFAGRFSKQIKFTDNDMGALIQSMGKWILRGPVQEHELFALRGITTGVAATGGSYEQAIGLVIEAMLQSPRFLYRFESQQGDGTRWPLEPHALANRVSYLLWGSSPDAALVQAAEEGLLYDSDRLKEEVARMLEDPRAIGRSEAFLIDWLNLNRLNQLSPSAEYFPNWSPQLAKAMQEETIAFFRHLVWEQKRPLHELFNARFTFLNQALANHYQIQVQEELPLIGLQKTELTADSRRGGLLTHGSVLSIGGDEASMVARGLFMLHEVLRGVIQDPPPCVDVTPVPTGSGLSQRVIATKRIENKSCGGCHSKFEPLAFAMEQFDGLGRYQRQDRHGNLLREDGALHIPGDSTQQPYATSLELLDFIANHPRAQATLTWKIIQFAMGRPLTAEDAPAVEAIHQASMEAGGTWASLMTALITHPWFTTIQTEQPQ